jgi:hypothetical protein
LRGQCLPELPGQSVRISRASSHFGAHFYRLTRNQWAHTLRRAKQQIPQRGDKILRVVGLVGC